MRYLIFCWLICLTYIEAAGQVVFTFQPPEFGYCVPTDVLFFDQTSPNPTSWLWEVTGPNPVFFTSNLQDPGFTFTVAGDYTVKLTVNGNPTPSFTDSFTFFAPPIADFSILSGVTPDCAPSTICFQDESIPGSGTIDSIEWDLGIPPRQTISDPCITYPGKNELQISLVVWDENGCQSDITSPPNFITIYDPPDPIFTLDPVSSCQVPLNVQVTNTTFDQPGTVWDWDFPGSGVSPPNSNLQDPGFVTYTEQGTYDVSLTTADNFCTKDTTAVDAIVVDLLVSDFTYSPLDPCEDQIINFTHTANLPGATCDWYINNVWQSSNCAFAWIFQTDGSNQVMLVVTSADGECRDTTIKTVFARDRPFVNFIGDNTISCGAPFVVNFTPNSVEAITWDWSISPPGGGSFNDNLIEFPQATFVLPGTYSVTLDVTSVTGCVSSFTFPDYIEISDNVDVEIVSNVPDNEGCLPLDIEFDIDVLLPAGTSIVTKNWTMTGGSPASGTTCPISTTFNSAGDYTVTVDLTFDNGCAPASNSILVEVGDPPTLTADITPFNICLNEHVTASATSDIPSTEFTWYFEPPGGMVYGGIGGASNVGYTYEDEWQQPWTVLMVGEVNGCKDTVKIDVTVNPPAAQFGWVRSCETRTEVAFTPDIDLGFISDDVAYYLDGALGNPIHTADNIGDGDFVYDFGIPGIYEVQLVVSSAFTGCTDSVTKIIDLFNTQANALVYPRSLCPGETVSFYDNTESIETWQWSFGDGDTSGISVQSQTFTHVYTAPGIYTANVFTLNSNGCRDTLSEMIYVGGGIADIGGILGACEPPLSTPFSALQSVFEFGVVGANWVVAQEVGPSDEVYGPLTIGPYDYNSNGLFTVYMEAYDSIGCVDDTTIIVNIGDVIADFTSDVTNICPGQPVSFTNLSLGGNLAYFWEFGDGEVSTIKNPVYDYPTTGDFTVILTVTDTIGDCSDQEIKVEFVHAVGFITNFIGNPPLERDCPPLSVDFEIIPPIQASDVDFVKWYYAESSETSFSGETVEGFTVGFNQYLEGGPDNGVNGPGYYDVALVVQVGECRDSIYRDNYIRLGGQRGGFTFDPDTICVGESVHFEQIGVERTDNITWDFGGGNILTAPVATTVNGLDIVYTLAGVYKPVILLENDQCPPVARFPGKDLYVSDIVSKAWVDQTFLCDEGPVEFRDSSFVPADTVTGDFIASLLWDFGDDFTSTESNPVHEYSGILGDVIINLSAITDFGCQDDTFFTIKIFETPDGMVSGPSTICISESVQLSASGADNYLWTPSSLVIDDTSPTPFVIPNDTTEFMVLMYNDLECPDTGFVWVNVLREVDGVAGPDAEICQGQSTQLEAIPLVTSDNGTTYTWVGPNISDPTVANPIVTPTSTVIYTVLMESGGCIPDQISVLVEVGGTPFVNAGPDQVITQGETVDLLAFSPNIVTYTWFDIDGNFIANDQGISVTPSTSTSYIVEVGNEACRDIDTVDILILESCDQGRARVPNIFTPNGDGVNDELNVIPGLGVAEIGVFRIFNRWGELVFEANSESVIWDGTQGGEQLDPGVFVYYMELICSNDDKSIRKGNITLLK